MESTESTSRAGNREDKEPSVLNRPLGKGGAGGPALCCARPPGGASGGRGLRSALALRSALPRRSVRCRCAAPGAVGGHGALRASVPGEPPPPRRCAPRAAALLCSARRCPGSSPSVRSALGNASPWGPVRLPGFAYCKTVGPASSGGKVRSPPPGGSAAAGAWHGSARLWEGWGCCGSRCHLCIEAGRDG